MRGARTQLCSIVRENFLVRLFVCLSVVPLFRRGEGASILRYPSDNASRHDSIKEIQLQNDRKNTPNEGQWRRCGWRR